MATSEPKSVPKISVKIWRPILEKFDKTIESACLRRDAYLNKLLNLELGHLDSEVCIANSLASQAYVNDRLDRLDRKLVSLALAPSIAARLNEICNRKGIVRDAFFNRLFLLLGASPNTIDQFLFGGVEDGKWTKHLWQDWKDEGRFFEDGFYPHLADFDPFWGMRSAFEMYLEDAGLEDYFDPISGTTVRVVKELSGTVAPPAGIYTTVFEKKFKSNNNGPALDLLGLSCFFPDWRIPGHQAEQERTKMVDEMFAELDAMSRSTE